MKKHTSHAPDDDEELLKVITIRARGIQQRRDDAKRGNNDGKRGNNDSNDSKWKKTEPSKQDLINAEPDMMKQKLLEFERISAAKYAEIDIGTFIRYIRYDKDSVPQLRLGGYLIKNSAPDYWVLKSGGRGRRPVTWSVPLRGSSSPVNPAIPANEYYMKRGVFNSRDERTRYGVEVYEALESGKMMLIETGKLEALTGQLLPGRAEQRRKRATKFQLQETEESEEEDEVEVKPPQPRIRARFRDD